MEGKYVLEVSGLHSRQVQQDPESVEVRGVWCVPEESLGRRDMLRKALDATLGRWNFRLQVKDNRRDYIPLWLGPRK